MTNPSVICLGPHRQLLLVDASRSKVFSARLHYPVDVTEKCNGLNTLLAVVYRAGVVVYVAEYTGSKVSSINLEGKTVYNPERITVKDMKVILKDLKLAERDKNNKKKDQQQKQSNWTAAKKVVHTRNLHRPKCKVEAYSKLQMEPN